MSIKGCVAMILAGGRGERLGALTNYYPKPAVHFGTKRRIIDFTLENCKRSGIAIIGILSQYFQNDLHSYIQTVYGGKPEYGTINMLPSSSGESRYRGTADAVYKNIAYIEKLQPENVIVLAGDHVYKMNYERMLEFHNAAKADMTVAATYVAAKDASRFGIFDCDKDGQVYNFEEKPAYPKSRLASMGIYIFKWKTLRRYLLVDNLNESASHDFGKDILPAMLRAGESMYTYRYDGYWRDVGTVASLWEANMDYINHPSVFRLIDGGDEEAEPDDTCVVRQDLSRGSMVRYSILPRSSSVFGRVEHSILGDQVTVGKGSEVVDSVVMPGVYIGDNVRIYKSVIGTRAVIMDNTAVGLDSGPDYFVDNEVCSDGISLIAPWLYVSEGMSFRRGSHVYKERLQEMAAGMSMSKEFYYDQLAERHSGYFRRRVASVRY